MLSSFRGGIVLHGTMDIFLLPSALKSRSPMALSPHRVCASLLLGIVVVMGAGAVAQNKDPVKPDITVTLLGSGG